MSYEASSEAKFGILDAKFGNQVHKFGITNQYYLVLVPVWSLREKKRNSFGIDKERR